MWALDDNLLINIERIFWENADIALVGLVGTNDVPVSGIAQKSWNIVGEFCKKDGKRYGKKITKATDCLSVFGGFMALRFNVDWQENTFNNRIFYDTALTLELQEKRYKTVLIPQAIPAIWNKMALDEHVDETVQDFFWINILKRFFRWYLYLYQHIVALYILKRPYKVRWHKPIGILKSLLQITARIDVLLILLLQNMLKIRE